jgi:predicted Fe-S protein YdhL (DUF1289 family)
MEQPEPVNQDDIKEALATLAFDVENLTRKVQELAAALQPKEEAWESVTSPCIGVCIPSQGVCTGCGRTMAEVSNWVFLSPEERQRVRHLAASRLQDGKGSISG